MSNDSEATHESEAFRRALAKLIVIIQAMPERKLGKVFEGVSLDAPHAAAVSRHKDKTVHEFLVEVNASPANSQTEEDFGFLIDPETGLPGSLLNILRMLYDEVQE
jgi:hypothetical protein